MPQGEVDMYNVACVYALIGSLFLIVAVLSWLGCSSKGRCEFPWSFGYTGGFMLTASLVTMGAMS